MKSISSQLYGLIPRYLPSSERHLRRLRLHRLYDFLYKIWEGYPHPVQLRLHGRTAWINGGNSYPFIAKSVPSFNAPLVELCHQAFKSAERPVTVLDVGAATGDSVFLIKERCPGMTAEFVCIEGDAEFFHLLQANMLQFTNVEMLHVMLAAEQSTTRSLVKHHKGTAAAIGDLSISAVRLDSIDALRNKQIDVLKIDVDGFDGEVLSGATGLLALQRPAVIFEWHPALVSLTGNDPARAFAALSSHGYTRLLWFNNIGTFSHFSDLPSSSVIKRSADYLNAVNSRSDPHFDIVALHKDSPIDDINLAKLDYARLKSDN